MSKFKSFASQSSFRDYQLQAPDETAKIKEQTAKTIRGKQRAEEFRQGNAALYLQAQKLVQGLEEQNRETNFRLETENRQAFRDQLNEEYKLQVQSDDAKLRAQQRNLQNITEFSQTALKLYGEYEQHKTTQQTKANAARVYRAGADYNTVVAIKGLASNLTKAELAQTDFIAKKLEEGGNIDAYYELYKNRNTRGFINNIGVAQNEARAYTPAAQEFLKNFGEQNKGATAEQTKLAFQTWTSEYVANIAPGLNADLLNNTVYNLVRQSELGILGDLDNAIAKERERDVTLNDYKTLNVKWDAGGGADSVIEDYHTTDPSERKRKTLAGWMVNRLKAGTMTPEEAMGILRKTYTRADGAVVSWETQFPASEEIGLIKQEIRAQRRAKNSDYTATITAKNIAAEQKVEAIYLQELENNNGVVSQEGLALMEQIIDTEAAPDYVSPFYNEAQTMTVQGQQATAAKEEGLKMARAGSLTTAYVKTIGNYEVQKELMPIAEQQEEIRGGDNFKNYIGLLKSEIIKPKEIVHSPISGIKNSTVLRYQHQAEQDFRNLIFEKNLTPEEAFGAVLQKITAEQNREGAIDSNGNYTRMLAEMDSEKALGEQVIEFRRNFTAAAAQPQMRKDAYYAVNAYGQNRFYEDYYAMQRGEAPSGNLKFAAGRMFMSPLETMNFFAAGLGQPPITVDQQVQNMMQNINPNQISRYNAPYSTNEMRGRTNASTAGYVADLPRRSTFGGPTQPLSSYAPQVSSIVMEADDGQPGMDIFFEDKKFPAVLSGVVKEIGWQGNAEAGYGNFVVIESIDPGTGQKVDVLYSHLEMPTHLTEGSTVMPGTIIGKQGGTGSVRSADGTVASIDFLAPAPKGSNSMTPYKYFKELRERIATQLNQ